MKNPSRCNFHMRIAPISEIADRAISNVKYNGEIASTEFQFEYLIISSEVFVKKTDARKYPIKEAVLPMNVRVQSALKKTVRFVFTSFILNYYFIYTTR
jgi:hypothetical protein